MSQVFDLLPSWAKLFLLVFFPTFVACFYMGKDIGIIPSPQSAIAAELHGHIQNDTETIDLLRQICINTTPVGNLGKCFPAKKD